MLSASCYISSGLLGKGEKSTDKFSGQNKYLSRPPNIVFFILDDLGYFELSCMGNNKLKTPNPELHGFDTFFGYYHQVHAHCYFPNYLVQNSLKIPLEGNI